MKTTTLKMPKELKEDVEPVKKIMYGQDENIKKWHTSVCWGTQETAAVMFSQGRKSKKTTKQNSQADNYNN
jgi:hypothetical protein